VNLGKQIKKKKIMASMEGLIGLMNRIQRACTALGDHGGGSDLPTLWESLPTIAVVGGQVLLFSISLRSSILGPSMLSLSKFHRKEQKYLCHQFITRYVIKYIFHNLLIWCQIMLLKIDFILKRRLKKYCW
jgi:hypothetical protein